MGVKIIAETDDNWTRDDDVGRGAVIPKSVSL